MQLNQNLLKVSRKACATPTQSSSSWRKAQKESRAAGGESPAAFPRSSVEYQTCQSSQGLLPDAVFGWGSLSGFCCRIVATGSKDLKERCCKSRNSTAAQTPAFAFS